MIYKGGEIIIKIFNFMKYPLLIFLSLFILKCTALFAAVAMFTQHYLLAIVLGLNFTLIVIFLIVPILFFLEGKKKSQKGNFFICLLLCVICFLIPLYEEIKLIIDSSDFSSWFIASLILCILVYSLGWNKGKKNYYPI